MICTLRTGQRTLHGVLTNRAAAIILGALLVGFSLPTPLAKAEGLPEPPLVLYGTIRNLAENNQRVTSGTLTWQFRKVSTGRIVTLTVPLENVVDQFSYVLLVSMEGIISGAQISSNALD